MVKFVCINCRRGQHRICFSLKCVCNFETCNKGVVVDKRFDITKKTEKTAIGLNGWRGIKKINKAMKKAGYAPGVFH